VKRTIFSVSWTRCFVFRVGLLAPLAAGTASSVELREAELVADGSSVLQNAGSPNNAWVPNFRNGNVFDNFKTSVTYVRAVRAGSCL
jgi:hypothetical protein